MSDYTNSGSGTQNNINGTQSNIWGSQYTAARDQYVNCTFIGVTDLPLTEAQRHAAFSSYMNLVRIDSATVKLIGAHNTTLPLEAVYVNLKAARRYDDAAQEQYVRATVHEYEEQLNKDEKLTPVERFRLLDECRFWFRSGLAPQNEEMSLDEAVVTYPRLVILGEPGSGKTTLLRYLAHQFARVGEQDTHVPEFGYRRLPILVRLPELVQHGFDPFAAAFAATIYTGDRDRLIKLMREYAERGLVLFLFDGLDEVDSDQRGKVRDWLDRFAASIATATSRPQAAPLDQQSQGNRMIITCRINSYFAAALDHANAHYVIQPLKTADRRTFLATWYTAYEKQTHERQVEEKEAQEWAEALAQKLEEPRYDRLADVPLLLSFLAYIWCSDGRLPDSRALLYARMVKQMMAQRTDRPIDPAVVKQLMQSLAHLAYCLNANNDAGTISQSDALRFFPAALHQHWDWLVKTAGVLTIRGTHTSPDEMLDEVEELLYGFPHRTFEEYFAAICLANLPAEKLLPTLRRHLHDPRWEEVILLTLGHLYFAERGRQRERAQQLLWQRSLVPNRQPSEYEDLLHRDLLFALRACADGITPPNLDALAEETLAIYFDTDDDTGKGRYTLLRQQIEARFVTNASGDFSKAATPALLKLLADNDRGVRARAARAAGELGVKDERVVDALLGWLADADRNVRDSAASALGELGVKDERVVAALLGLLADANSDVRGQVAWAVGLLGVTDERVVAALLGLLADTDSNVRYRAASAVGQLGVKDERVVDALLGLLADNASNVRDSAASALRWLGVKDERVVAALLGLLTDNSSYVRYSAASALWQLGVKDERVVAALLGLLADADSGVRWRAAEALGLLGVTDEWVVAALLSLLADEDSGVRWRAAAALGQLEVTDERVVAALLGRLTDANSDVRGQVAWALGQLGMNRADVRQALYQLALSRSANNYPEPYNSAYEALYTIISSQRSAADTDICGS